jgi:hypothetical protein
MASKMSLRRQARPKEERVKDYLKGQFVVKRSKAEDYEYP